MKNLFRLSLILVLACGLLMPAVAGSEDVTLYPGYISGTVTVDDYNIYGVSISAGGGGYSSSKSVSGNEYTLTVQGGDWNYNVNTQAYMRTTSSTYPQTSMYFRTRSFPVSKFETVTNDYTVDPGMVRFKVTITGDPYNSWNAYGYAYKSVPAGQEQSDSRSFTHSSYSTDGEWDMPVVPNSQIRIHAYVYVDGKGYGISYVYHDIAAKETVVVPINIHYKKPIVPPPNIKYGSVQGTISMGGVENLTRHYVYGGGVAANVYSDPGTYLLDRVRTGNQYFTIYSYFDRASLQWPYANRGYINIAEGQTTNLDFIADSGTLTGELKFSGTTRTEDLYYQLRAYGATSIYVPGTGWVSQTTLGGYAVTYKPRSDADSTYRLQLTPGPWRPYYVYAYDSSYENGYVQVYRMYIYDYNHYYDGSSYNFGQNADIVAGETLVQDREYCTGSVAVHFIVAGGGLVSNPRINGSMKHYNDDGKLDISATVYGQANVYKAAAPEVVLHGPEGTYNLIATAYTEDGSYVNPFGRLTVDLECGVEKKRDFDGPTLNVEAPPAGLITNALTVTVSGTATDDSGIESITVNGTNAAFHTTGNSDDPNEVAFSFELPVDNGKNTITVVAFDIEDKKAEDSRDIYVDRWIPQVNILSPEDGSFHIPGANVPAEVTASDQGYGFTLKVYLDGSLIHQADGPADDTAPASISFSDILGALPTGNHELRAEVTDVAGNSASDTAAFMVYLPATVTVKPESRNNKDNGTMTIFVQLSGGMTSAASLSPADTVEVDSGQHPYSAKLAGDSKLILKFHRTQELMADNSFTVQGKYCPDSSVDCLYWRGSDTTKK